jgi:sulfate adenylyltransferase
VESYGLVGAPLADLELILSGALPPVYPPGAELPRLPAPPGGTVGGGLVLTDPEGFPLARLEDAVDRGGTLTGRVVPLAGPEHGVFRALRRRPDQVPAGLAAVVVDRPLRPAEVAALPARPLLLVRVGDEVDGLPADVLLRSVLAAGVPDATVVAVPLRHLADPAADERAVRAVAAAYGAGDVLVLPPLPTRAALDAGSADLAGIGPLLRWRPPRDRRGLVVFFTGLSGSGKSTLARALVDRLLEDGRRTLTVLDGDEVRRMLSAGLGFSRADRDLNVRRIGWVAAEVARHGGTAVCAPIAPYAATRAAVRRDVEATGDFVLVHVATPLAVCEARDRKGLYAKARAGEIPGFTGISDPYEAPADADLVLDTTDRSIDDCAAEVLALLVTGGWLPVT